MKNQSVLLKLSSLAILVFSSFVGNTQNYTIAKENFIWKRDVQVLVGYPIVNSFKTIAALGLYNKVDYFNSKKYPYFEITVSHTIGKTMRGVFGLSYYQNEIYGAEFHFPTNDPALPRHHYNIYQIIKSRDLRLLFLLSYDHIIKQKRMLRATMGLGCHFYPQRNGDAELIVSNYYSKTQDPAITYFPTLAINGKCYRSTDLLGWVNPIVKLEYFHSVKRKVGLFLGFYFTYVYIPYDSGKSIYAVFERDNWDDYSINYDFSRQLIFGIHAGLNIHSKSNSK